MVNNSIQLFIAGFLENKKSLIFSDFIIVGSNSLQLITISYLPMQNFENMVLRTSSGSMSCPVTPLRWRMT